VDEIDAATFSVKNVEFKDRLAGLKLQMDACDRGRDENAYLAIKAAKTCRKMAYRRLSGEASATRNRLFELHTR
jgi:hypothetical protein